MHVIIGHRECVIEAHQHVHRRVGRHSFLVMAPCAGHTTIVGVRLFTAFLLTHPAKDKVTETAHHHAAAKKTAHTKYIMDRTKCDIPKPLSIQATASKEAAFAHKRVRLLSCRLLQSALDTSCRCRCQSTPHTHSCEEGTHPLTRERSSPR